MSAQPRAAEATANPIWGVQRREIHVCLGGKYQWCSDCERYFKSHSVAEHPCGEDDAGGLTAAELFELGVEEAFERWIFTGALFLSREEAEKWRLLRSYRFGEVSDSRVYCYSLEVESSLVTLLNEHAPTVEGEVAGEVRS